MAEDVEHEPDLLGEHLGADVRKLTDAQRDELAAELDMTRPEVDALLDKMAKAWAALAPADLP